MSAIITGLVWDLPIDGDFGRPEKYILLAYGDHADQNGKSIYPSIELISKKTGYEERAVQTITRSLEKLGYLLPDGQGPKGTNRWMIPLERTARGAKIAPLPIPVMLKNAPEEIAPEGNAPEEIAPEPITVEVKIKEEEEEAPKIEISKQLQEALQNAGIYATIWPEIEKRLADDWIELDIQAVINWMSRQNQDPARAAQRTVARIREGTKAPAQYYPQADDLEPTDSVETDDLSLPPDLQFLENFYSGSDHMSVIQPLNPAGMTPAKAWDLVLEQMRQEMPKDNYDRFMQDTRAIFYELGHLQVEARGRNVREWLEDRVTFTVSRMLQGICNLQILVEFVEPVSMETA